jgi:uncharacterized protein (DUF433 family)
LRVVSIVKGAAPNVIWFRHYAPPMPQLSREELAKALPGLSREELEQFEQLVKTMPWLSREQLVKALPEMSREQLKQLKAALANSPRHAGYPHDYHRTHVPRARHSDRGRHVSSAGKNAPVPGTHG